MKSVLQIIALWLFGLNPVEMIIALATIIVFFHMLMNKFMNIPVRWNMKKRVKEMEKNMWVIE